MMVKRSKVTERGGQFIPQLQAAPLLSRLSAQRPFSRLGQSRSPLPWHQRWAAPLMIVVAMPTGWMYNYTRVCFWWVSAWNKWPKRDQCRAHAASGWSASQEERRARQDGVTTAAHSYSSLTGGRLIFRAGTLLKEVRLSTQTNESSVDERPEPKRVQMNRSVRIWTWEEPIWALVKPGRPLRSQQKHQDDRPQTMNPECSSIHHSQNRHWCSDPISRAETFWTGS